MNADLVTRRIADLMLDGVSILPTTPTSSVVGYNDRLTEGDHRIAFETMGGGGSYTIALYGGVPGNSGGVKPNSIRVTSNDEASAGDTKITVQTCSLVIDYDGGAAIAFYFTVVRAVYTDVCQ